MTIHHERVSVFHGILTWHYGQGLREFFATVSNIFWFVSNFFSFKVFYQDLWQPISLLGRSPISSLFGFIARAGVMIVGIAAYAFVALATFMLFVVWVLAPGVLIGGLVLSATFFAI